ncbi:hypothetical protein M3649_03620 [Ureibacillus chungkukjangi]|uniref:hypothetical protein n=1 Tax=Ureibacillus chungkukjangi TaxID=1202712 RepID=UPI00203CF017|nr:hypothetical protein [Ureibacillus chungkukjangi]MCM3387219.1 hypothetical protein [Ureibacillus chungkukjangi]
MKHPQSTYESFGFGIYPVKNGYKVIQDDGWIYDKVYYTKKELYEWLDFLIDFFRKES